MASLASKDYDLVSIIIYLHLRKSAHRGIFGWDKWVGSSYYGVFDIMVKICNGIPRLIMLTCCRLGCLSSLLKNKLHIFSTFLHQDWYFLLTTSYSQELVQFPIICFFFITVFMFKCLEYRPLNLMDKCVFSTQCYLCHLRIQNRYLTDYYMLFGNFSKKNIFLLRT
ncbi:hypothetical protein QTP88_026080 [Uroleucon formosanum]